MAVEPKHLSAILERIGLQRTASNPLPPTLATLKTLCEAWIYAVPFENTAALQRKPAISLDIEALVQKIVVRRNGGFCYELNGLFGALLEMLGFARPAFHNACVNTQVREQKAGNWTGSTHCFMAVKVEDTMYMVDPGFGFAPVGPLVLELNSEQTLSDGTRHRFTKLEDGWWCCEHFNPSTSSWVPRIKFEPNQSLSYPTGLYEGLGLVLRDSSPFRQNLVCYLRARGKTYRLNGTAKSGLVYSVQLEPFGEFLEARAVSEAELRPLLKQVFGIVRDESSEDARIDLKPYLSVPAVLPPVRGSAGDTKEAKTSSANGAAQLSEAGLDPQAYLTRMGVKTPLKQLPANLDTLKLLTRAHLWTVPFDNLSLHRGPNIKVSLDLPQLYRKIVTQRLGGFCFELNGLFSWLLESAPLSYKVRDVSACVNRAHWDEEMGVWSDWTHLLLLVDLEAEEGAAGSKQNGHEQKASAAGGKRKTQQWIVDVGFGAPPVEPLLLEEGLEQKQPDGFTYRVVRDGEFLIIQRHNTPKNLWTPRVRWHSEGKGLIFPQDFQAALGRVLAPSSWFQKDVFVVLLGDGSMTTLSGTKLIKTATPFGQRTETRLTEAEAREALKTTFGETLDESEAGGNRLEFGGKNFVAPAPPPTK